MQYASGHGFRINLKRIFYGYSRVIVFNGKIRQLNQLRNALRRVHFRMSAFRQMADNSDCVGFAGNKFSPHLCKAFILRRIKQFFGITFSRNTLPHVIGILCR